MSQATTPDVLCVNTIRTLSIDAIEKAASGHPGLPLGAAPMAYVLWQKHLSFDPLDPSWPNRDRFVLSPGHGSALLYSLLHLYGYDLSLDDLRAFRQWGSKTPGHPEFGHTAGVEATTGPLGQGVANAVGMALAERSLAARFGDEQVDHHTFAIVSDGDLMEGIAYEAASIAGHLRLGKLVFLYDANDISLDGPLDLTFSEDVAGRFVACGWHVQTVADGDTDLEAIDAAITAAKADTGRPSIIIVKTTIGFGSPNKGGSPASHGAPLGAEETKLTKDALGWTESEPFTVPAAAREFFSQPAARGATERAEWQAAHDAWRQASPELAATWDAAWSGRLPEGWDAGLPSFETGSSLATRVASGQTLNAIAAALPWFLGGDADLGCSTMTLIKGETPFDGQAGTGRSLHYGVREHAMASIANGIAYHGGLRSYTGTFFVFSDYMRPAMRLAAMNSLPVTYVFTHDSIGLGEDGPTHQPVEHLAGLRAMPGLVVLRPADANETKAAWRFAMEENRRPTAIVCSRQKLETIVHGAQATSTELVRGAYVLRDAKDAAPRGILIATGAEVHLALAAQAELAKGGIEVRVVSMPSWELFADQTSDYRASVLPTDVTARVSIEAGATFGWERWTGDRGVTLGIDKYGASAPGNVLFEKYGMTVAHVVQAMRGLLGSEAIG